MFRWILVCVFLTGNACIAQTDSLFLFVNEPFFNIDENRISYGFSINSKDKRFVCDYYGFSIPNIKGFSENGKWEYYLLEEIRKEIDTHRFSCVTIQNFTKNKRPWEIHNELSLKEFF